MDMCLSKISLSDQFQWDFCLVTWASILGSLCHEEFGSSRVHSLPLHIPCIPLYVSGLPRTLWWVINFKQDIFVTAGCQACWKIECFFDFHGRRNKGHPSELCSYLILVEILGRDTHFAEGNAPLPVKLVPEEKQELVHQDVRTQGQVVCCRSVVRLMLTTESRI